MPSKSVNKYFDDALNDVVDRLNHAQLARYTNLSVEPGVSYLVVVEQVSRYVWRFAPITKGLPAVKLCSTDIDVVLTSCSPQTMLLEAKGKKFALELVEFARHAPTLNLFG